MRGDRGRLRALCGALLLAVAGNVRAERLAVQSYSASDGLPGGTIGRIFRDSRGFLWFCSGEGAVRFDGYTFTPFGKEEGLGSSVVHDVIETRDGAFWLATAAGLCRLHDPSAGGGGFGTHVTVFRTPAGQEPSRLFEDPSGTLWCGTTNGILRVERAGGNVSFHEVDLGLPHDLWDDPIVEALADDGAGGIWVGAGSGLYRLKKGGVVERITAAEGLPANQVRDLAVMPDGTLWVATLKGIARVRPTAPGVRAAVVAIYSVAQGLASDDVNALHPSRDGRLWAGSVGGLSVLDGERFTSYNGENGIGGPVFALEESADGDFWIGSEWGAQRLAPHGLLTYGAADGIADPAVNALFEDQAGEVGVLSNGHGVQLSVLGKNRFDSLNVRLPPGITIPGWAFGQALLQDHLGEWWLPTLQGLCRFAKSASARALATARPIHVYTASDGLATNDVFVVFEDSRGDVWISTGSPVTNGLARWTRAGDRIERFRDGPGLPSLRTSLPTVFAEDRGGNVWIAFNGAGLARYRAGRFDLLRPEDGVPEGWIRALLVDRTGRLWIAAAVGGLAVIDDPLADHPRPRRLASVGFSSSSARCLADDTWGRIYVGTGVGVDQIDPDGAGVHHFTTAEGLAPGTLRVALRDRHGAVWFGTSRGLSRYVPSGPEPRHPPSIFVTGVRVEGSPRAVPALAAASVELPDVPHDRNRVQVDFVSTARLEEDSIRYQYRLEGAAEPWSPPGVGRTVDFASLSPGRYRFEVRAIAASGAVSLAPAEVRFRVLAPVWRRPWFFALALAVAAGVAWSAFQYRLRNLVALERVRTRIAADLHDDIGSSLSRIAILSEVVKRQTPGGPSESSRLLTEIAETSRHLVDTMSDIVWSIDPRRDDLKNLLARIGQFASGALEAQGIHWKFDVPSDANLVKLTPEQRRGTFLILKEAITNALKHAGCRTLSLRVAVEGGLVTAEVRDDGRGLPRATEETGSSSAVRGRGLANMRVRAREIGGKLTITSSEGAGTAVRLEVPHGARGKA
jgi:signal transduction histidine kinase/ligand-binding sensor domain-containing protein